MLAVPDYEQRLEAIHRLERVLVDDAGHMLHHDQPAQVAQLVADFLGANSR
jgi:pimeloyl-ACP methyl ester carboxylesterase